MFTIYQFDSDNFVSYCVDFNCPQIYKIAMSLSSKWNYFLVMVNRVEEKTKLRPLLEEMGFILHLYIGRLLSNPDKFGLRIQLFFLSVKPQHISKSYGIICPLYILARFKFSKNRSFYFNEVFKIYKSFFLTGLTVIA